MIRFVLFLLLVFLVGCSPEGNHSVAAFVGADVGGAKLGGDIALTDQDGRLRRLTDFKGRVVALFFGYTHCPDVCPTTMADLNRAVKQLGAREHQVQVLFVTLDPARDTAEVLKKYLPYFNREFIGLRGSEADTRRLAQDYKVFYARQATNAASGYTIDHTAGVYVFDRSGSLRLYLNHGQKAKDIAHDFRLLLDE